MAQIIPIYIPTYISSQTYAPAKVLPRLFFYNGLVECEPYYFNSAATTAIQLSSFPYFDNYNVVTGSFPTAGSNSLLFNNEAPVYGALPTGSLYTEYWQTYISLLYNPVTRLFNCEAIIPLADYFQMELNDIVSWRNNYYHLRAINDYNLKNGECKIQLLGPVIPDVITNVLPDLQCEFLFTQSLATPTTTIAPTTSTTTTAAPLRTSLAVSQSLFSLIDIALTASYTGSGATIFDISGRNQNATIQETGSWNYNVTSLTSPTLQLNSGSSLGITFTDMSSSAYTLVLSWYGSNKTTNILNGGTPLLYEEDQDPGNNTYGMVSSGSQIQSEIYAGFIPLGPASGASDNAWHISQVSFDDNTNTGSFCIDGITGSYSTTNQIFTPYRFKIFGEFLNGGGKYGSGSLFQIAALYTGSLTTAQMLQNHNSVVSRYGIITPTTTTTTIAPTTTSTTTTIAPTTTTTTLAACTTYQITNTSSVFAGQVSYVPCGQTGYRNYFVPQNSTITLCVQSNQIVNSPGYVASTITNLSTACTSSLRDCISYQITNFSGTQRTFSGTNCANCAANTLYPINGGATVTRCLVSGSFSTSTPGFVAITNVGSTCNVSGSGCPI